MPRFELLELSRYNRLTVQTQRGCPYSCEFCAASIRLQPKYRTKPIAKIMAEVDRVRELWPHPFIEFADDNTFADKRHGKALARELIGRGVRWFTETDVSVADDPELLSLLRPSGCAQVLIGLESPTPTGLAGIETKADWKSKRLSRYRDAIARIQDAGVTVNGCFVLGLDGTGEEAFDAVYDFVEETGLYEVQITLMTPFPGTPLYERLLADGRILEPGAWERCTLFDVNYRPEQMSPEELERGFRGLAARIYDSELIEKRRRKFHTRQSALRREKMVIEAG